MQNVRVVDREIQDPIMTSRVNQLRGTVEQILNFRTLTSRGDGMEGSDPRRNIAIECGHPTTSQITLEDYQHLYDRNPIATKANDILPDHCWQLYPRVQEDEAPDVETPFEKEVSELGKGLSGESHYNRSEGNPFWEYLHRADRVCGIGHYGVILLGIDGEDGADLSQPLVGSNDRKLIFMRVFPEQLAPIKQYDNNQNSPRFGLPEVYQLQMDDADVIQVSPDTSVRTGQGTIDAHWTRVVHVVDTLLSNEVFHIPRLRPSYDRYTDLDKLFSGSAEMYYKGAFPGYHFGTHPSLGGDVEVDSDSMKSMTEEWLNGLQRTITTSGFSVDSLAPQVVDPTPQIDVHIKAICIEKSCPKRIFEGSERGELASGQDTEAWLDVVNARRNNRVTPRIIVPTIDRLIQVGVLSVPSQGYGIIWPEVDTLGLVDKATVAFTLAQAIAAFIAGDGEMVLPLPVFLTSVLGFPHKEAQKIMDTLDEEVEEDTTRQKVSAVDEERHLDQQKELQKS